MNFYLLQNLFGHVTEYPQECVAYLIQAIKDKALFKDKMKTLTCLLTFLAWLANWIDESIDDNPVIGQDSDFMSPEDLEECCEFIALSGYEVPAAGPLTNLLLEQLKAAALKWLFEFLSDPEAVAEALRKLVEALFEKDE